MWEADIIEVDPRDPLRIWVKAPRSFPHGLDELVGAPILVDGVARSIRDVMDDDTTALVAAGDRLGLILDPLD